MVEQSADLATWQVESTTKEIFSSRVTARRIHPHRKAYLDYQGPVSGGRGAVRQVEAGTCEVLQAGDDRWQIRFDRELMSGVWDFTRQENGDWWMLARE